MAAAPSVQRSTFPVRNLHRYSDRRAAVREPQEITYFSFDDTRTYRPDASSLRYYYTPTLGADLSKGFETFDKHDDSVDEHLNGLLKALERLERETGERVPADIVTWRGMMTKIMTLPFDRHKNAWEMNAVRFQGTVYIEDNYGFKMGERNKGPAYARAKLGEKMSYWGYKFETLSTLTKPWDECTRDEINARDEEITSNKPQFCSIVKTSLRTSEHSTTLVLGGEVDALWDSHPPPPSRPHYVELKTSALPETERQDAQFEEKLCRFWAQSFLLGVKTIVVGFRDRDGILMSVKDYETASLPSLAKRSGRQLWDAKFAVDFWEAWCEWLKESVVEEGVVYRVRFRERGSEVECFRTEGGSFLEEGFVKWREELLRREGEGKDAGGSQKEDDTQISDAGKAEGTVDETNTSAKTDTEAQDRLKALVSQRKRELEAEPRTLSKGQETEKDE